MNEGKDPTEILILVQPALHSLCLAIICSFPGIYAHSDFNSQFYWFSFNFLTFLAFSDGQAHTQQPIAALFNQQLYGSKHKSLYFQRKSHNYHSQPPMIGSKSTTQSVLEICFPRNLL